MKDKLLEFLKGVDNELSSKRLKGLSSGFIFDLLCLIGGLIFLFKEANQYFIDLLWVYGAYSLTLLGSSIFERKFKYGNNKNASSTNIID